MQVAQADTPQVLQIIARVYDHFVSVLVYAFFYHLLYLLHVLVVNYTFINLTVYNITNYYKKIRPINKL